MNTTALPMPTSAGCRAWRLTGATEQKVSELRETVLTHLCRTLAAQGRAHDRDALLAPEVVVAELVTNAMRHGDAQEIDVLVAFEGADIWIAVADTNGTAHPRINPTEPGVLTSGQGMRLVDALTNKRWSTICLGEGKLVTALCRVDDRPSTGPHPAPAQEDTPPVPSLTPSHDGMTWLARACPADERPSLAARWSRGERAAIPTGALFSAVAIAEEHAAAAIDHLSARGLRPGPVLADRAPSGTATAYFLIPPGTRWPGIEGTRAVATGCTLPCPRPGSRSSDTLWLVPPDGSGHLTDPCRLADALSAAIPPTNLPAPVSGCRP